LQGDISLSLMRVLSWTLPEQTSINHRLGFCAGVWSWDTLTGIKQAFGSSIFINFNSVAFLEVCQSLPACSTIFPLNTKVPTFGCFPHFLVADMRDVHFSRRNGMTTRSVVNNDFHKIVLSAFNVTLSIHIFCNHIGGVFITAAIRKLNFISSCI
jgi:hypothetical protein